MDIEKATPKSSVFTMIITGVIVLVSIVVLYYVYNFLYGNAVSASLVKVIQAQVPANIAQQNLPAIQNLYEGGDYSVSLWMYVNSYNINRNRHKHVLEIGGANFSTLLIALGAFKNSLLVRTHSRDSDTAVIGSTAKPSITSTPSTTTTSNSPSTSTSSTSSTTTSNQSFNEDEYDNARDKFMQDQIAQNQNAMNTRSSFTPPATAYDTARRQFMSGMTTSTPPSTNSYTARYGNMNNEFDLANQRASAYDLTRPPREYGGGATNTDNRWGAPMSESFQNATPGSSDATRQDGSLTTADLDAMFTPLAMDDSLLNSNQICDIPNIDMQRWINVTVVLSGRTIDVYMDGKLVRSCVTPSYYKVDGTGVKLKITERGGFDGYINTVSTFNRGLTPGNVYNIYQAGPTGKSADVGSMVSSLFTGK